MENKNPSERELYLFAFKTFGDFGITIAVPAVLAALLGKWLDTKFGTEPRYVLLLLVLAFILTAVIVVKKTKEYGKLYQELFEKKKV